jgi:hypothetical protein
MSTKIPLNVCSQCGYKMDRATAPLARDAKPREGMVSICWNCGHLTMFTAELNLRELTPDERSKIENHPLVVQAQIAVRGWPKK